MNDKQLRWFTVALIAFNMVWGMGNVVNNYAQQGISVVTSWLLILAIYFIPNHVESNECYGNPT